MTLHQDLVLAICGVTISVWLLLFCIYWNRFQINERIQHTRQLKLTPHYLNHFHAVRYNKGMQNAIYFLKVMIIITAIIAQLQIALII